MGPRVFLKLRKRLGSLSIIDVSPGVFEIFEMTGFSQLMDVQKRLCEVSLAGCEVIGTGGNGCVYRLDDDKIVKVFAKPDRALVEREQAFARAAFVSGVPCVIPYDVIRCGDIYGLVFEMIRSDTLSHAFVTHPERMGELVDQYVELAQTLHATPMPKGTLPDVRDLMRQLPDVLSRRRVHIDHVSAIISVCDAGIPSGRDHRASHAQDVPGLLIQIHGAAALCCGERNDHLRALFA